MHNVNKCSNDNEEISSKVLHILLTCAQTRIIKKYYGKLYKLVAEQGLKPNNPKVIEAYKWLDRIGVSFSDALKTGIFKKFDMALKNPAASKMLNESGWLYSNRDAIIPQTSNRLLFTMSRNPYLRLVGQFMSWAMGKSTQTHKMLQRIESGDIRTFIKMIAAVPFASHN